MKHAAFYLVTCVAAASLVIAGCAQPAPSPTPTKAPAAPIKAAEPTKPAATQPPTAPTKAPEPTRAPTVAPTAPPAKKVDFPEKGKAITMIVPYAPGGSTDVAARVLAPLMEKELGTAVQVANKAGAGSQVGLTELAKSKPDGYTMGYTVLPTVLETYLDPARKAVYTRKDFQPLAAQYLSPIVVWVQGNGPYKTLKDLVDAAKANPDKVKGATSGPLGISHMAILMLEKAANVKFAPVHFDGGGPGMTALLGGHVDAAFYPVTAGLPQLKTGQLRALGVADRQESAFLQGVKTMESQGYKVSLSSAGAISAPAGTPKEIVGILSGAAKKAIESDEHKKKMQDMGLELRYMDAAQFEAYWSQYEADIVPLRALAKQ